MPSSVFPHWTTVRQRRVDVKQVGSIALSGRLAGQRFASLEARHRSGAVFAREMALEGRG
jgi:hypothetical protein